MMAHTFSSTRKLWQQNLAISTTYLPQIQDQRVHETSSPDNETWHDDYFRLTEWGSVKDVVAKEGEEMLLRGLQTSQATTYNWIHAHRRLGEGTYGSVRVVKNRLTGEINALKVVQKPRAGRGRKPDQHGRDMASEGALLRMLRHPHVVGFVEEVALEHEVHLVMELCDGGNLASLINRFGPLDLAAARWFTSGIVDGLQYLHRHGISHQDLKPANCLLARQPSAVVVKLADFGLCSWKAATAESSGWCGTPEYVAPEVASPHASRRRRDIWALGVCVLEMLTGRTLWDLDRRNAQQCQSPADMIRKVSAIDA
eukprot:CAMPEP_0202846042 /NCGR_PEP_ID=MMETSP1389-20130828/71592_1 /ASSEMBLY_ACC=CAM_ASM_000865 /TAXON_ID=302021 /ORGANISM="Rhodomonas sp., Strain CCMP768" /LENGTH=312 /DNA_ID=CAMNT_0049523563 /DNA_START=25 /DNA_END=959 /DNA_ORIENTATION=-